MEKALSWICILLTGCLLLFMAPPTQGLQCFKCNLESEPNCVDRYPPEDDDMEESDRLVECNSYDTACIIYEYQLPQNGTGPPERMGGQRCFCEAEKVCLGKQDIDLDEDKYTNVTISFKAYQQCMDDINKMSAEGDLDLGRRRRRRRRRRSPQSPAKAPETGKRVDEDKDKPQTKDGDSTEELTQLRIFYCTDDGCNKYKKGSGAVAAMMPGGVVLKAVIMISMFVSVQTHFTLI